MTQPKDFGFGEEEQMLRDSVRKFFQDNFPTDRLHGLVAGNPDPRRDIESLWDRDLWQQIVELGWSGLAVPERAGGIGMSAVAVAAVVEEIGRAAFPSPFVATLNACFVLAACENTAAESLLEKIVEGQTASLAITNKRGSWDAQDTDVEARGSVLNGTAWFVQDAMKADHYVVSAIQDGSTGLYAVAAGADGMTVVPDAIVDLTRDQAHIEFNSVKATALVTEIGAGEKVLTQSLPARLVVLAADMCGAAEWQLQSTVEYAKTREQFGHPIGFFQAIKHPLVDLMTMIDQARSLLYNAACAIDHEPEKAQLYARMAKASASDMAAFGSSRAIQSHGGIGFTWECFQHLYFKRQKHNQQLLGDGAYQREKLAETVIGPLSSSL